MVELAEGGASADPGGLVEDAEGDGVEVEEVEDDEGYALAGEVGEALVVVAAAAGYEVYAGVSSAVHGGGHVGLTERGDDELGLWSGGGVEAGVAGVCLEDSGK